MKLGIVGLPNVGKSTLFNAITSTKNAEAANYPFCTIEPNSGIVAVPDKRLDKLAEIWQTNKKTPAIVEFVDIAGLVKGASQGAGLGNKFLGHIRECDAIVHVVRCFDDDNIIHVVEDVTKAEAVDPIADIDAIDYELILSDLEVVQNRAGRMAKAAKSGNNKGAAAEAAWLQQLAAHLESGKPARSFDFDEGDAEQQAVLHEMGLLSSKPVLYACNVGEDDLMEGIENNRYVPLVAARAAEEGARYIPICAKTEEDIADYSPEEKKAFLAEMGIEASGLDNLITASYDLLGLISFLTDGKKECRAWTIRKGTKAPQAAGKIHSDFERGFIRASVIGYNDLEANNFDYAAVKAKGLQRTEGKEYVVKDGDVIEKGCQIQEGALNPHDVLRIRGASAVHNYLIQEVLKVYRQQGVDINDKHIEVIVRQMMRKVRVEEAGDTTLLSGSMVDIFEVEDANKAVAERIAAGEKREDGEELQEATYTQLLMGITKASLATDSFLSAASFQETTKVLTEAAIKGKEDKLIGLKENVIIGKLIPVGTGMKRYRNTRLSTDAVETIDFSGDMYGDDAELNLSDGTDLDAENADASAEAETVEVGTEADNQ